jgi:probable HAF family extracellular repeat protein
VARIGAAPRWLAAVLVGALAGTMGAGPVGAAPRAAAEPERPPGAVSGFVLVDGRYERFDAPDEGVAIYPSGINDEGQVVGEYMRDDGESGFVRDAQGRITTFDVPGASATEAVKVNDAGQVVGRYSEDTPFVEASAEARGFVRRGGRVTRLDVPGATATRPTAINDAGDVVGTYTDVDGATRAFLWRDGRFTPIDLQGATEPTPVDINDRGDIVGQYVDAQGMPQGFLLQGTRYATIAVPGAVATIPSGIDDEGRIVGYVANGASLSAARGVLLERGGDGRVTATGLRGGSIGLGINDAGDVVGLHGMEAGMSGMADVPGATDAPGMMPAPPPATGDRPMGGGMPSGEQVTVRGITVNVAIAGPVEGLLVAAEAAGLDLTGSGYRSHERQIELRRAHCGTSDYAVYEMPSSQCSPPTARPGASMHEQGLAIDFSCDGKLIESRSHPCFTWLAANAPAYGLANLPSEPWHWSTNGR